MALIHLYDKTFTPYISAKEIAQKVQLLALAIQKDYKEKTPLFIAILNGSFMFAADMFKALNIPAQICFIKLSSYIGTKSSKQIITAIGLDIDITNRDVIILEDIVDTGKTLHHFLPQIHNQHPASLKICALLHKPQAAEFLVNIDYVGFVVPNKFVVGYGLDYNGLGRNLKAIYRMVE
jgi:hypoxanthine phosphoribosyltransferase